MKRIKLSRLLPKSFFILIVVVLNLIMTSSDFKKSTYCRHFENLKYIGAWVISPKEHGDALVNAYLTYKTFMTLLSVIGSGSLIYDFYMAFGDFKKMTWNLCITTLFTGGLLKNIYTIHRSCVINNLRIRLHREGYSKETLDDEIINDSSLKELKRVRVMFYGLSSIFIPLWLVTRYISSNSSSRDIPVPLYIPIKFNFDNDLEYNLAFFITAAGGCAGLFLVLETELCMFSILIQISREYKRLLKDINLVNSMYEEHGINTNFEYDHYKSKREVNPWLRKIKTKILLKEFSTRQQHLIEYTNDFEFSYGPTLLLHTFVLSLIVIVSAIQCILEYGKFSMNLSYQIGYIIILVMDMFLICWYATTIREQCFRVGEEFYSTVWYRMSTDIQRDIRMIIMRSQRPPKITCGKIMEVNLHAFMIVMRNIYSWLTLFQQLESKFNVKDKNE